MPLNIRFTFRKLEPTDALKQHVTKRIQKLERYVRYPMEAHVTLWVDKALHCAEVVCRAEHQDLVGQAKTKDLYESIDTAVGRIATQLKKERERHKVRTSTHLSSRPPRASKLGQDVHVQVPHLEKKRTTA